MLTIDGSRGEGGGQILRSSVALSLVTGRPFRIEKIRAGRRRPGLMRQHLTAVRAAARIAGGKIEGDEIGSQVVTFRPGAIRSGSYRFEVGTAGSTTLVLQTVLPALLTAPGPSKIRLEGGTHNPAAPPFDFLQRVFLPLVSRMGPRVEAHLERPGFYPAGGGAMTVSVTPCAALAGFDLPERGGVLRRRAVARVARLPAGIADRELAVLQRRLQWTASELSAEVVADSKGPGNVVLVEIESEHAIEIVTAFGARGVRAETVADHAARDAERYLAAEVPVGVHLADQLLLPLALAGGGSFRTLSPSRHTSTNIEVLRTFLDVEVRVSKPEHDRCTLELRGPR